MLSPEEKPDYEEPTIVGNGEHESAKVFLLGALETVLEAGLPHRAVYNGYEMHVDGSVEAEDLEEAYQAVVRANKSQKQAQTDSGAAGLKRAA